MNQFEKYEPVWKIWTSLKKFKLEVNLNHNICIMLSREGGGNFLEHEFFFSQLGNAQYFCWAIACTRIFSSQTQGKKYV